MSHDLFISYAREDLEGVAEPLYRELRNILNCKIWFDKESLQIGDYIPRQIEQGIAGSRYAVVILSPAYLGKEWTLMELDGLLMDEASGNKTILPILHNLEVTEVAKQRPILAARVMGSSTEGGGIMAKRIGRAIIQPEGGAHAEQLMDGYYHPFLYFTRSRAIYYNFSFSEIKKSIIIPYLVIMTNRLVQDSLGVFDLVLAARMEFFLRRSHPESFERAKTILAPDDKNVKKIIIYKSKHKYESSFVGVHALPPFLRERILQAEDRTDVIVRRVIEETGFTATEVQRRVV